MRKRNARSRNNGSAAARRSNVVEIPKELVGAIKRCWPRGVVEEFANDESYFHKIHHQIERDLGSISSASLLWQTEEASGVNWDDDNPDEPPPPSFEWQSYHVFFISHDGKEFRFEDETIGDDPKDGTQTMYPGEGRFGLALTISLAARFAAIHASSHSWFEDGSFTLPDPTSSFFWDDETGKAISADEYYRDSFSQEMFQKLQTLRQEIVSIMTSHRISVLDESVLDLPVKGLRADPEVFLQKPLRVRDAFFFRGV
jgi:hypothetical protein